MAEPPYPGSDHLLVLPDRAVAESIAEELREEGFTGVRVLREAARTEDDSESHLWAVHVHDTRLPDSEGGGAYEGLRDRFIALAAEHDGWYDEPGDPRPPRPDPAS